MLAPAMVQLPADTLNVILIEDSADDAFYVRKTLPRTFGFQHATTLQEGMRLVGETRRPLCAVLDLSLPDAEGLEALSDLLEHCPAAPVVVLTGREDEDLGLAAVAAGAQDYLVKGRVNGETLARAIRYAVERREREDELEEVRERFRRTFEEGPIGICLVAVDPVDPGRIIEVNQALEQTLGQTADALLGRRLSEFAHWEERGKVDEAVADVLAGNTDRTHGERRLIHADGSERWCSMTASGVADRAGAVLYGIVLVDDVTDRRRSQEALYEAHAALDNAVLGIAQYDVEGRCRTVNRHYANTMGCRPSEMRGRMWHAGVHEDDRPAMEAAIDRALAGDQVALDVRGIRADGTQFDKEVLVVPNVSADGRLKGHHHFMRDITERKVAERALRHSEARYKRIVETANEGVWIFDKDGRTTFVNRKLTEMLGFAEEEMMGRSLVDFTDKAEYRRVDAKFPQRRGGGGAQYDILLRRHDGSSLWGLISTSLLLADGDEYVGMLVMMTDITDRKRIEGEMAQRALQDSLTGLPNRTLLEDRLDHTLRSSVRDGRRVGVLFIDLDRFKGINDGFGHAVGDNLLRDVAPRLAAAVRPGDTLARFGGDEFVVLCEDLHGERDAVLVADRILAALREPLAVPGGEAVMSASIGVAVARAGEATAAELIRDADTAMYQAKQRGGDRQEMFDRSMRGEVLKHLKLEAELRHAIANDELRLHFQPIVSLPDERATGLEALVRWQHPEQGLLGPDSFIPLAERTGLIKDLGRWVLREACLHLARWTEGDESPDWARVAVNVSACQLEDPRFPATVAEILEEFGIEPHRLQLELTETALLSQDGGGSTDVVGMLEAHGVEIVLDDFGTGYSSLSYLHKFPLDGLKLDRAFIDAAAAAERSTRPIVEAVTAMAQSFGLTMVGEGVETLDQAQILVELGCDYAQGFLFARPMPPEDVQEWIGSSSKRLESVLPVATGDPAGDLMTLGQAAEALGVSATTMRRWADDGRISAVRTAGGHRRFPASALRRFMTPATAPKLRLDAPPAGAMGGLADALERDAEEILRRVCDTLYEGAPGWYASARARRPLREWIGGLARSCRTPDPTSASRPTALLVRHADLAGASLLETTVFLERFGAMVLRGSRFSREAPRENVLEAQRLFRVVRRSVLAER